MQHLTARTILLHDRLIGNKKATCAILLHDHLIRNKKVACTILLHDHLMRNKKALLLILAHHSQRFCMRMPHVKRGLREIRFPDSQCPGLEITVTINPVAELIPSHLQLKKLFNLVTGRCAIDNFFLSLRVKSSIYPLWARE